MNNKPKKVTEINIAKFYKVTTQTLRNYRNSDDEAINRRYEALRAYCIEHMENQDANLSD